MHLVLESRNYIKKKYRKLQQGNFIDLLFLTVISVVYLLFLVSFLTAFLQLYGFSRKQILGSCIVLFLLEIFLFSGYYLIKKKGYQSKNIVKSEKIFHGFSVLQFIIDAPLLFISFHIINYVRRGTFSFSNDFLFIAFIIMAFWSLTAIFTRKFQKNWNKNIWYLISPYIKSIILMLFGITFFVFIFWHFHFSRLELFGTVLIFGLLEIIVFSFLIIFKKSEAGEKDIESVSDIQKILKQENLSLEDNVSGDSSIVELLEREYLSGQHELYNFISENISLKEINEKLLEVIDTKTSFNIQHLISKSISLFINLHQINDFRWLNRYLLLLYEKVTNGGYFVGNLETNKEHKRKFYQKFPNYLARLLYIPNFIFRRICPQLPGFKQIYFFITDGKNRALSKAEIFGRLYFCGFSIIAEKEINDRLYFIARKEKTSSIDQNPSYEPIIKLKKIGLNGDIIHIYMFRTMYPYSEYLQEYVYKLNYLNKKGKLKDDFRITEWGKWFRRLWIDELPQIINWLRGDVSFVGVRALSQHFFDLYPKDLQKLRIQFKPGLVPPYYADMPETFNEIVDSERRYLERKKVEPLRTDFIYFFKAFYNIIFKGARSS
ncbi:MAG: sugar transferase [Candidatus Marinimicrobia bacterium]|nr:sugar transferase [Candidatus Neomarinimicrobiota bacterium]